jgi:hypothetical protein
MTEIVFDGGGCLHHNPRLQPVEPPAARGWPAVVTAGRSRSRSLDDELAAAGGDRAGIRY